MFLTERISLYRHLLPLCFGVVLSQIYSTVFFIAPIFWLTGFHIPGMFFFLVIFFSIFRLCIKYTTSQNFVICLCTYLIFIMTLTFTPIASGGFLSSDSFNASVRLAILGSILFFSIFTIVPRSVMLSVYWWHVLLVTSVTILTYGLMLFMGVEHFIAWSDKVMISITGRDDILWNTSLGTTLGDNFLRLAPPGLNSNNAGYSGVLGIILASSLIRSKSYVGSRYILLRFCQGISLLLVLGTFSRQSYLSLTLIFLVQIFLANLTFARKLLFFIVCSVLIGAIWIYVPVVLERFLEPFRQLLGYDAGMTISTSDRFGSLAGSLDLVVTNPWGIDILTYKGMLQGMSREHNLVLSTAVTHGLPTAFMLFAPMIFCFIWWAKLGVRYGFGKGLQTSSELLAVLVVMLFFLPAIAVYVPVVVLLHNSLRAHEVQARL